MLEKTIQAEIKNAVVLILKGGIGSGILLNGNIFRGENGIAGELGHISLDMNGPKCKCGSEGCLEVFASDFSIINEVRKRIDEGHKSILNTATKADVMDIGDIIHAAQLGDELSRQILFMSAGYVGTAISNIIKAYDPGYVVIESRWIREVEGMFDAVLDICRKKNALLQKNNTYIVMNQEEELYLKGAVMLAHDYFMESISSNKLLE